MANYMNRKKNNKSKKVFKGYEHGDDVRFGKLTGYVSEIENDNADEDKDFEIVTVTFKDGYERKFNHQGFFCDDGSSDPDDFWKAVGPKLTVTGRYPIVTEGKYLIGRDTTITVQREAHENSLTIFFKGEIQLDSITKKEFYKSFPSAELIK